MKDVISREAFEKMKSKAYKKGYQQGRADALEECWKLVARYDDKGMSLDDVERITDGILKELEQLKEKKNGKEA